jgi:hypothetical protein
VWGFFNASSALCGFLIEKSQSRVIKVMQGEEKDIMQQFK